MTQLTKEHLDKALDKQTKELKGDLAQVAGQVEDLAGMVQRRFDEIELKLDVREQVARHDRDIRAIKQALHLTK